MSSTCTTFILVWHAWLAFL